MIVVSALMSALFGTPASPQGPLIIRHSSAPTQHSQLLMGPVRLGADGPYLSNGWVRVPPTERGIRDALASVALPFVFFFYLVLLVGLTGQSLGMIIANVRVVTIAFGRPGFWRIFSRYAIALLLLPLVVIMSFFRSRLLLHDRLTKTRLIRTEALLDRAAGA